MLDGYIERCPERVCAGRRTVHRSGCRSNSAKLWSLILVVPRWGVSEVVGLENRSLRLVQVRRLKRVDGFIYLGALQGASWKFYGGGGGGGEGGPTLGA